MISRLIEAAQRVIDDPQVAKHDALQLDVSHLALRDASVETLKNDGAFGLGPAATQCSV